MPINRTGGNKHRRTKNHSNTASRKPSIIAKGEGEAYGRVQNALGSKRFMVEYQGADGLVSAVCEMASSVRQRVTAGAFVRVQLGVYSASSNKGRIVDIYKDTEVEALKRELLWDYVGKETSDGGFQFTNVEESETSDEEVSDMADASNSCSVSVPVQPPVPEDDFDIDAI
jgi:translation initiation factor IF-1